MNSEVWPVITLDIPRVPASLNETMRSHWRHRLREGKLWQREVWFALLQAGHSHLVPYARAKVTINRRSRGQLDPDNLVGSMKPVIDALRYAHVLLDDTPDHLELVVTQTRQHDLSPRTLIQIQPLEATT